MKASSAKAKGRRHQQRVRASILEAFGTCLGDDDVRSTSMGAGGEDILLSPRAREMLALSIECKCQERISVWDALSQAERNANARGDPCVVFTRNRSKTWAIVEWKVLLQLYVALRARGEAEAKDGGGVAAAFRALRDALRGEGILDDEGAGVET